MSDIIRIHASTTSGADKIASFDIVACVLTAPFTAIHIDRVQECAVEFPEQELENALEWHGFNLGG